METVKIEDAIGLLKTAKELAENNRLGFFAINEEKQEIYCVNTANKFIFIHELINRESYLDLDSAIMEMPQLKEMRFTPFNEGDEDFHNCDFKKTKEILLKLSFEIMPAHEPIEVMSKGKIMGQHINTQDLIQALKNPVFTKDNAPVTINTADNTELLSLIYKCRNCNKIHLVGGDHGTEMFENMIDNAEKIYVNNTYSNEPVTKRQLLDAIESITDILPITLEIVDDEHNYSLTRVFKCSEECDAIHLDCFYDEHVFDLN